MGLACSGGLGRRLARLFGKAAVIDSGRSSPDGAVGVIQSADEIENGRQVADPKEEHKKSPKKSSKRESHRSSDEHKKDKGSESPNKPDGPKSILKDGENHVSSDKRRKSDHVTVEEETKEKEAPTDVAPGLQDESSQQRDEKDRDADHQASDQPEEVAIGSSNDAIKGQTAEELPDSGQAEDLKETMVTLLPTYLNEPTTQMNIEIEAQSEIICPASSNEVPGIEAPTAHEQENLLDADALGNPATHCDAEMTPKGEIICHNDPADSAWSSEATKVAAPAASEQENLINLDIHEKPTTHFDTEPEPQPEILCHNDAADSALSNEATGVEASAASEQENLLDSDILISSTAHFNAKVEPQSEIICSADTVAPASSNEPAGLEASAATKQAELLDSGILEKPTTHFDTIAEPRPEVICHNDAVDSALSSETTGVGAPAASELEKLLDSDIHGKPTAQLGTEAESQPEIICHNDSVDPVSINEATWVDALAAQEEERLPDADSPWKAELIDFTAGELKAELEAEAAPSVPVRGAKLTRDGKVEEEPVNEDAPDDSIAKVTEEVKKLSSTKIIKVELDETEPPGFVGATCSDMDDSDAFATPPESQVAFNEPDPASDKSSRRLSDKLEGLIKVEEHEAEVQLESKESDREDNEKAAIDIASIQAHAAEMDKLEGLIKSEPIYEQEHETEVQLESKESGTDDSHKATIDIAPLPTNAAVMTLHDPTASGTVNEQIRSAEPSIHMTFAEVPTSVENTKSEPAIESRILITGVKTESAIPAKYAMEQESVSDPSIHDNKHDIPEPFAVETPEYSVPAEHSVDAAEQVSAVTEGEQPQEHVSMPETDLAAASEELAAIKMEHFPERTENAEPDTDITGEAEQTKQVDTTSDKPNTQHVDPTVEPATIIEAMEASAEESNVDSDIPKPVVAMPAAEQNKLLLKDEDKESVTDSATRAAAVLEMAASLSEHQDPTIDIKTEEDQMAAEPGWDGKPVDGSHLQLPDREIFVDQVLAAHNKYRLSHNAPPVVLSKYLCDRAEKVAKLEANDETANSKAGFPYGENVWLLSASGQLKVRGLDPVQTWYEEWMFYHPSFPDAPESSHFTQVVWKSTESIGVGMSLSSDQRHICVAVLYDPAGNVPGRYSENITAESS